VAGESFEAELATVKADLARLVRRLRSLSPRSWQPRRPVANSLLAGLVELSASLERRPLEPPGVPDHVLADAVAVIGGDVLAAITAMQDQDALAAVSDLLRNALDGTR
jgi:hypothetical protein